MTYASKFILAVKSNGKFIKEDRTSGDPVVWLDFGSEYSLYFKNLANRKAVVSVSIDGNDVLDGKSLIVEPNKPFELERFLSDMNKGNRFKFIEKTNQISEFRGENPEDGLIQISFQYELDWASMPLTWPSSQFYYSASSINYSPSVDCCYGAAATPLNDQGITAKGSISNQQFSSGQVGALETQVHTIVLQLKGKGNLKNSKKFIHPVRVEAKRSYCPNCGTIFLGWPQFCSNCGSAINAEIR